MCRLSLGSLVLQLHDICLIESSFAKCSLWDVHEKQALLPVRNFLLTALTDGVRHRSEARQARDRHMMVALFMIA